MTCTYTTWYASVRGRGDSGVTFPRARSGWDYIIPSQELWKGTLEGTWQLPAIYLCRIVLGLALNYCTENVALIVYWCRHKEDGLCLCEYATKLHSESF